MTVSIRALADAHIPAILDACSDWEELAQFGPPYWRPRSEAELHRKVAATAGPLPATEYSFVLLDEDGQLVGECSIHAIDWRSRVAQVGICVWNPSNRRRGYGSAGVQFATVWAIEDLGLERLEAWIVEGNDGSVELFTRLGYVHEASLSSRYVHAGSRHSVRILAKFANGVPARELPQGATASRNRTH